MKDTKEFSIFNAHDRFHHNDLAILDQVIPVVGHYDDFRRLKASWPGEEKLVFVRDTRGLRGIRFRKFIALERRSHTDGDLITMLFSGNEP